MLVKAGNRREAGPDESASEESVSDPVRDLVAGADAATRRRAAQNLRETPERIDLLCERLGEEPDASVRAAILISLLRMKSLAVAAGLVGHLRSENAALRSEVMEALQDMPDDVEPVLERLLEDPDSDVRIFVANILNGLAHPRAPKLLARLIARDPHVNVCMAALDGLMEIGDPSMTAAIADLPRRFPEPFVAFAATAALKRLKG
ncbi:HEAT repeat domain-containing protein [Rhodoblastus acidophilus]|uniref:HEAT repeat domain-containing protein n=1 Tax=Rhodoblastus acidophilus TaxID=1074 RepID=A0A6N8DLZ3_RHOAC|nr:HEAT repeat domain-containing protein [Rhodoblastus acidophilus]